MSKGHILVDFDGTLATYTGWNGPNSLGEPITPMVDRVKLWLSEGKEVKIFTARVCDMSDKTKINIEEWCKRHIGQVLEITRSKDYDTLEIWDDRAVGVIKNTGRIK